MMNDLVRQAQAAWDRGDFHTYGSIRAKLSRATGSAFSSLTYEPFPTPKRQEVPCGECRLRDGEVCDVCGASNPVS